jgi:hypothetical protein
MFFELRQYRMQPGKQQEFAEFMDTVVVPFQRARGMVIVGNFIGEDDESVYVWIRRFRDEAERLAQYEAVYQSQEWKTQIAPRLPDLMDRSQIVVTRLTATEKSVIQ